MRFVKERVVICVVVCQLTVRVGLHAVATGRNVKKLKTSLFSFDGCLL